MSWFGCGQRVVIRFRFYVQSPSQNDTMMQQSIRGCFMSDVINFNQKRKAKARVDKDVKAAENRYKFGRTKTEKQKDKLIKEKAARDLAGHKREDS